MTNAGAPASGQRLDGPIVDLLIDIAHHGLVVGPPVFPDVKGGQWADFDFGAYSGHLTLADSLTLLLEANEFFGPLHDMREVRNKPASVQLADGSKLDAELAHMRRLGAHAEIDLHHWVWSGSDGFRLDGAYTWYLLPREPKDSCTVIVDAGGAVLERNAVVRDMLVMQFCFGGPIGIGPLVGIDEQRRCVGAFSLEHLVRSFGKHRSPVPDYLHDAARNVPQLFQRLASKLSEEGLEPLIVAIASYLDAETDHLDGGYLKAQVGLEAFANRLVGGGRPELLVQDQAVWKAWVKGLAATIEGHLVDRARIDMVLGKLVSAMYAPTGDAVRRAFEDRGIELPKDVVDEIKKRNYPAHRFLMNDGLDHDIDRDVRRLEMIQTVLAALVALHVGYGGPLKGYDLADGGKRPNPVWWPTSPSAVDEDTGYVAERASAGPSPGS